MKVYDLKTGEVLFSGLVKDAPSNVQACPPLAVSDNQAAVEIARQSGVIDRIAQGQPWTPSRFFRSPIAGTSNGVVFNVTWEHGVESDGPWTLVRCQGTRMVSLADTWASIRQLRVHVDVERREVVAVGVESATRDIPGETEPPPPTHVAEVGPDHPIKVYDLESRRVIFEGAVKDAPLECPPGKHDD
jgi:hypothetical protein